MSEADFLVYMKFTWADYGRPVDLLAAQEQNYIQNAQIISFLQYIRVSIAEAGDCVSQH